MTLAQYLLLPSSIDDVHWIIWHDLNVLGSIILFPLANRRDVYVIKQNFIMPPQLLALSLIPYMPKKIASAASFLRLGLLSTLICHVNAGSFSETRSSNPTNLKTLALRFSAAFPKRCRRQDNYVIFLPEFSSNTAESKMTDDCCMFKSRRCTVYGRKHLMRFRSGKNNRFQTSPAWGPNMTRCIGYK